MTQDLIYLDSCLVIYFIDEHPRFGLVINHAMESHLKMRFCISPLVELECLVMPLRQRNQALIKRYEMFFEDYVCLEINACIYRKAAELRARQRLKTPDALHLATAQSHGCAAIWTNDERLHSIADRLAVNVRAQAKQSGNSRQGSLTRVRYSVQSQSMVGRILMNDDEIDDIRRIRQQIASRHGHDVKQLAYYYRQLEQELRKSGKYRFADKKRGRGEYEKVPQTAT
ncbi:MAG: type II toxin-antitoxin system VapC family toxin [Methylococcales bacterium]